MVPVAMDKGKLNYRKNEAGLGEIINGERSKMEKNNSALSLWVPRGC